jgi:hypothetical protein
MADKKPEGPIGWTQTPAQGAHEDDDYGLNVEEEAAKHGDTPTKVGGHGQGGAGH